MAMWIGQACAVAARHRLLLDVSMPSWGQFEDELYDLAKALKLLRDTT
jgi:hypothetical protein